MRGYDEERAGEQVQLVTGAMVVVAIMRPGQSGIVVEVYECIGRSIGTIDSRRREEEKKEINKTWKRKREQ